MLFLVNLKLILLMFYFCFSFSSCRFVEKYTEFKSYSELDDATAFEETGKALLTDGIVLRRRGAPSVRGLQPEHFLNSPVLVQQLVYVKVYFQNFIYTYWKKSDKAVKYQLQTCVNHV